MYSKRVVTLLLIFLLLSSCAFIGLRSIRIDKKGTHFRIPNLITAYNVDLRSSFAGGNGTENDPYQISNLSQLQDMNLDLFADYMLVRDIDASKTKDWNNGKGFYPIGDDSGAGGNRFYGSFNGKGHNITELYINRSPWYETGLFGCVSNNAYVHNITLVDNKVNGHRDVGGIVGWNCGIVENCSATGNATGDKFVGGLVGFIGYGMIVNCYATVYVTGANETGGLVGMNNGPVKNCYATGNVSGDWEYIGGLIGTNWGTVENCSATGNVTGDLKYIGGLVGMNWDTLENCYATGNVTGGNVVGGLVGGNSDTVKNCFATGNVSGNWSVGGLLGWNDGYRIRIVNCYAVGNVTGDENVGGLVGFNSGTVKNCYATGYVTGDIDFGGLVGFNLSGIVENGFWDKETSHQSNSDGGIGKTTIEMMTKSTFTEVEWDLDSIWEINEYIDYPHLQWERRANIEADGSDNDSILDIFDDFPIDPAASIDTDRDGHPDKWNPGRNETNSTTGLHLDAFPLDPAASLDSDGDGMPDKWNPGMNQNDSTSDPPLELDIYPNDPDNRPLNDDGPETTEDDDISENPTDSSSKTWILVSFGVVFVLLIAVFIALSVRRKRKPQENVNLGRVGPNDDE